MPSIHKATPATSALGQRPVKPWGISAHAGITFPGNNLSPKFSSSLYGAVGLSYRFTAAWSAEIVGGYYGFSPKFGVAGGPSWTFPSPY